MSLTTLGCGKGQIATGFVGAYDSIANLVHVYEPARCTLSAYTGQPLVRLRRASDDAESDFSHVSASDPELNLAAIAAWAGGASYIVSVYDQKTGDTITNATKTDQPLFVASMKNGHAGGRYDGTNHRLRGSFTIGGALSQPFSVYTGGSLDAAAVADVNAYALCDGDDLANAMFLGKGFNTGRWQQYAGTKLDGGAAATGFYAWAALFNGASSQFWKNTVSEASGNANTQNADGLTLGGGRGTGSRWDGDILYWICADPSHSAAQRAAMETSINSYWSIY